MTAEDLPPTGVDALSVKLIRLSQLTIEYLLHVQVRVAVAADGRGRWWGRTHVVACLRAVLNDTYNISVFGENSVFYRNQRRLNVNAYKPQLARKAIVCPPQNGHYSSNAGASHPRGCPTGVGLTRRQGSVPWGVKSITNSSRCIAQRDKSLSYCPQRARLVGGLGAVTLSTRRSELRHSLRLLRSIMTCQ